MIAQELLFLGLLKESPKHGYEIKRQLGKILFPYIGIDSKSIYYPLKILENKGLLIKKVTQAGRRPRRFVYELTPKGNARFNELLKASFLNFKRPQFSLDLSLFFLKFTKPEVAKRRLRARILLLERLSQGLNQTFSSLKNKRASSFLLAILEHDRQMVKTEIKFLLTLTQHI
jgi:DNA-binding PadR family transcriptional regulator